ncbi:MAG: UpxY family transcription antiterminator [Bacteroidales bacterium]|nr:UpxY family transcription antiterminator [Bacteroidales bacterium]
MDDKRKWYVFYCKSRAEKKADEELKLREYEAYLPLMHQNRVWSDRIKKVIIPMFSGYIFVLCRDFEIINILQLSQIVAPVKIGSEFATIRKEEIEILRKIEEHGLKVTIVPLEICKGNSVEIIAGVLRGQKGVCIEDSNNNYVSIAIEGINQSVKLKIGKEYLRNY